MAQVKVLEKFLNTREFKDFQIILASLKWFNIVLNEFCIDIFVIKAAIKISRVPPYGGALGTQVDNDLEFIHSF